LLSTPHHFPKVDKKINNKKKVGINLVGKEGEDFAQILEDNYSDQFDFYFINTHLAGYGHNYEVQASRGTSSSFQHNHDFTRTFQFLASLDLLISSKLHLGLTALTFNTPFICFEGKNKTESFLSAVSRRKLYFKGRDSQELVEFIQSGEAFNYQDNVNTDVLSESCSSSMDHFSFLKDIFQEYSR
jgi:polysaccharide pyruvyl transferase WcaK-like protein